LAILVNKEEFLVPLGLIPMKEQQVRFLVRIPASLKAKLVELAQREHRSLNRQIEFLLDRFIREETKAEAGQSLRPEGEHRKRK
jgi:hypothetical protein